MPEVHLPQVHPAGRRKLVLVRRLAVDGEAGAGELLRQRGGLFLAELGPLLVGRNTGGGDEGFPEAQREVQVGAGRDPSLGFGRFQVPQFLRYVLGAAREPVDDEVEAVAQRGEFARPPGAQAQDGRAAQALVRDQQRPLRLQFLPGDVEVRPGQGNTRQVPQPHVLGVEREQRRHGIDDVVPHRPQQFPHRRVAPRRHDKVVRPEGLLPRRHGPLSGTIWRGRGCSDGGNTAVGKDADTQAFRRIP